MKKKNILKLFVIILGVIMLFTFSKVKAAEITSIFTGETLTRNNLQTITQTGTVFNNSQIVPITLGIEESEYKTNNGEYYWAIKDSNGTYKDIYCLNLSRGFGAPYGDITNSNQTKIYTHQFDFNSMSNQDYTNYSGLTTENKNKILWILNHSLTSTEDIKTILRAAKTKVEPSNISDFIQEDMELNTRTSTKLTFEDIKMIQQIAIWHYTNRGSIFDNTIVGICNSQGKEISGLQEENINTDGYGTYAWNGKIKHAKIKAIYQYFIDGAENANNASTIPTLSLSNTNVKVEESGSNYIVGPFKLEGTNTSQIKEIIASVNKNYTLLNSSKQVVSNNDFTKAINKNFYIQIAKSQITQDINIEIDLSYKYDVKTLIFITDVNDPTNTQPLVMVKSEEEDPTISTNASIELTQVAVEKVWNDNNNQDNKRPATGVKVQLYRDDVAYGEKVTLNQGNNWTYTWDKLLDNDDYIYTVKELNSSNTPIENNGKLDNNYTVTYTVEGNKTTITNTHILEKITVNGTKTWNDNNNQDGKRPTQITVNLLANGRKVTSKKVQSPWTYSFTNLDKYANGEEIVYTITEDAVENYTTTINGYNITNSYTPEKISVEGTKTWSDNDNQDGKRPEEITVNLLANGTKVTSKKVQSPWKYSFTNLDKYANGEEIVYTITEDIVENYTTTINGYNITNSYTPGKVSKQVIKTWDDQENKSGIRPEEIDVQLYKLENGQEVIIDTQKLSNSNNWTYTWTGLDEKANGNKIIYGIKEITSIPGYETTYSIPEHVYNDENTITITNTHKPSNLLIELQKVDKNKNIITSSETEFEINGTQEINSKTDNGILNLNPQELVSNTFEYNYTIKESKAPTGYKEISEELTIKITGTTKLENGEYKVDTVNIKDKDGNELDSNKILASYDETSNKVVIKVVNTKIENTYSVKLIKVGEDGKTSIEGAWFKVNDAQAILVSKEGNEIATGTLNNESELNLTYKLEETIAPEGYIQILGQKEVKIKAKVELKDNQYQITEVNLLEELEGITVSEQENVITIKVENKVKITGKYNVVLRKVDENGDILIGSKFKVNGNEYDLVDGETVLLPDTELNSATDIELEYDIEETVIPECYEGIENKTIKLVARVQKDGNNYKLIRANLVDNKDQNIIDENISIKIEGDSIVIEVKNTPIEKKFDLALRKFITKVNDIEYSREPIVDTSTIENTGTATYKHIKTPIAVQKGDVVTYTIRVYNEGEVDGYVEMITDHLPDNLLPIIDGIEDIDSKKYDKEVEFNLDWGWVFTDKGNTVVTTKTSKVNSETYSMIPGCEDVTDTKLNAYVEGSNKLDYIDVQIKCLVTENVVTGEYLTNIAEITDAQDINGIHGDGADSNIANVDISNLADYKNGEAINSTVDSYVEGKEDDDDFEKLVVKEFDLSLRKFITKVNETSYSRQPVVDTSKLGTVVDGKTITTAIYTHTKEPVIVETNDLVTYTIRIYNEGTLDGFANEITDNIPEGLEFLPNSDINVSYKWEMIDSEGNITEDVSKAVMIVTDYLSDKNINNVINAVSEKDGVKTLNYKDVEVQFKVIAKPEKLKDNIIINEAQISSDSDIDIDSIPNRNEKYDYTTGNNEDDIDYEPIKLKYFDLALRKFITKVNDLDYNNRYPEIKYNEDGSITYNHTKDPVLVTTNDIVEYTIRVYNEGEKAGYATELIDNLPEGLEFIPENEINKQYGWKLIDSEGNVTEDLTKAKRITTDYLKTELIDAFVEKGGQKVLSYNDVKIAFEVIEPNTSDRILVNTAEISNDSDDDIDSVPGNDVLTEDDIDREYVKVKYFDLSLKKWVTKTMVTYNGKTTTTKTGYTEDSDKIAKVDLVANKMNKTTVKFAYNIKVTNDGEIPGYVYEVKDHIPKGLKFVAEDNKDWKELEDGAVVTEKLKDVILNPGESATVEIILTWKNSTTNLGVKTNYAEISKDSAEDIDSTPDNFDKKEDDIDDAQIILSIKTAGATTYISLIFAVVTILAGGIFLIKKYVIK